MKQWIGDYIRAQKAAHDSIPAEAVSQLIETVWVSGAPTRVAEYQLGTTDRQAMEDGQ